MPSNERFSRNNPAAQALRKGRTFRDLRASESQITAEQLIAQAQELQKLTGTVRDPSKILLTSATELALYRQNSRKEFEEHVQRSFVDFGGWVRYAKWEEEQEDPERVRKIYERALPHHGEKKEFWRQYAEAEQRIGTPEHARKVLHRATTSLPQCNELWLKYVALEQATHRDDHVRQIFQRWMAMKPDAFVWRLAVQFECYRTHSNAPASSGGQPIANATQEERIRALLKDLVVHHNNAPSWAFYAGVELHSLLHPERSIQVLHTALQALPNANKEVTLHLLLAEALGAQGNVSEARTTLVRLLELCTRDAQCLPEVRERVFNALAAFERSTAAATSATQSPLERAAQEDALLNAQVRMRYRFIMDSARQQQHQEQQLLTSEEENRRESVFDAYASLAALEMGSSSSGARPPSGIEASSSSAEDVLRAAIATQPRNDVEIQQHASLVMALSRWMMWSAGNTTTNGDVNEKCKDVLLKELQSFPHVRLHNAALWTETCRAILSCGTADAAQVVRRVLGQAIGQCPDDELFQFYIWMEMEYLRGPDRFDRAREIYKSWLDRFPLRRTTWSSFAAFEFQHHEVDRADTILRMGITLLQQRAKESKTASEKYRFLDEVDILWKDRLRLSYRRGGGGDANGAEHTSRLYEELVQVCLTQYFDCFDAWRVGLERKSSAIEAQQPQNGGKAAVVDPAASGTANQLRMFKPPPSAVGQEVQPMVRRLAGAISGRVGFERRRDSERGMEIIRGVFQTVVSDRRAVVQQLLPVDAEFQQVVHERQWCELSLTPLFHLWRQAEAEYGSAESLGKVAEVAEPPKKKSRLFKSKS